MMIERGIFNGFLSGIVASLCCLGPTLIVLFGLGAMFGISGLCFSSYRVFFFLTGFSVFVFATGLYFVKDKKSCSMPTKKKTLFVVVSFVSMVITYLVILSFLVPYLQSSIISSGAVCSL